MSVVLPPMPEPFKYPEGDVGFCACGGMPGGKCLRCPPVNFYMNEQMRAYALEAIKQDRENLAKLCERLPPGHLPLSPARQGAIMCAEAIRSQPEPS